jgi:hypothetical protein
MELGGYGGWRSGLDHRVPGQRRNQWNLIWLSRGRHWYVLVVAGVLLTMKEAKTDNSVGYVYDWKIRGIADGTVALGTMAIVLCMYVVGSTISRPEKRTKRAIQSPTIRLLPLFKAKSSHGRRFNGRLKGLTRTDIVTCELTKQPRCTVCCLLQDMEIFDHFLLSEGVRGSSQTRQ